MSSTDAIGAIIQPEQATVPAALSDPELLAVGLRMEQELEGGVEVGAF